jgi:hypothetical protein
MDWWPVVSPDGRHVAFTRVFPNHMELDVANLRTRSVVHIGSNAGQLSPTWSGDGTRLAYASGGILRTVAANGTEKRRYVAPTRAFAPAWRPGSGDLAYLTTHGATNTDLWVAGILWARNVIGQPAWSADGAKLAFQRDDGIYVATGPGQESRLAAALNPGPPAWSHDGKRIAYAVLSVAFVAAADGTSAPVAVANALSGIRTPSWSADDTRLLLPWDRGVAVVGASGEHGQGSAVRGALGPGAAWLGSAVVASGARSACPGHVGIALFSGGAKRLLSGSCVIAGTPRPDVIEGTTLQGDVILGGAGNDSIHAKDGHADRVDCGPGRDTVWADRSDRLAHCEVVHR